MSPDAITSLFAGIMAIIFIIALIFVCIVVCYIAFITDDKEKQYIDNLDEYSKKVIYDYKQNRRITTKDLFKFKKKDKEE